MEEALSEKDDAVPNAKSGGASEQNLQIAADLELARKRCATIRTRPLEHQERTKPCLNPSVPDAPNWCILVFYNRLRETNRS